MDAESRSSVGGIWFSRALCSRHTSADVALGDAMSRFLTRSIIGIVMASVFGPVSHAGPKPELAAATAAGGSTDHALWEQRAAARLGQRTFIKDARGLLHYIVELDRAALARFDQKTPPADGFASWHKPSTRHLVQDL